MKYFVIGLFLLITTSVAHGQILRDRSEFTRQDSLRGSITRERAWWDLTYYDLSVKVEPNKKFISGSNKIYYDVLESHKILQVDLQSPMTLTRAVQNGKPLQIIHDGNAHFIKLVQPQIPGSSNMVEVFYEGKPRIARNAPWDGGFSWKKDEKGRHFIATSNQGLGASVWWPNKDHMYQEVDSMSIRVNVPNDLMDVSNGRLERIEPLKDGTTTYHWFVSSPINNYGVNLNIANYVNFSEVYQGEKGALDMDYYVLPENLERAQVQFKDAPRMMRAFEHWFGPYPFYEDSFKLVEVPYLGMEHQSSVTYGNQYKNGYLGRDLSGTGWGLTFDFIIVHESGHEWFANNITNKDIADMWIHESFTAYSETLFLDYHYGTVAAAQYVIGTRGSILNDRPIIGTYGVNSGGSGDMYYKGANMLHTIRQLVDNDEKWREILRGLNKEFYHQTVTTAQIEDYISQQSGMDLSKVFDQYLRDVRIPVFEYAINNGVLIYKWNNVVDEFAMPLEIDIDGLHKWITPTTDSQELKLDAAISKFQVDPDYYVQSKEVRTL